MEISVVICTRNRPDTIGQAVDSVACCDPLPLAIHVMDQSTDTRTREIVDALAEQRRGQTAIVYHHLDRAGLSRAYNLGIRACSTEVIALTDDDVVVPPDWIGCIAEAFAQDPALGLLYGQVLVPRELQDARQRGFIVPNLCIPRRERLMRGGPFRVFGMGANMALRRSSFDRVGGFDEALGGGGPLRSSQDFDYAYRTYLVGDAILFEPCVKVDHYGTRTTDQWPDTLRNYGIGDGAFYSKHIRCGDLRALRMFSRIVLQWWLRETKSFLLRRPGNDYGRNLRVGIRDGLKYPIDKKRRLYLETATATFGVTQSNVVTGAQKN
jgi:GT2 family glycosyltransferase